MRFRSDRYRFYVRRSREKYPDRTRAWSAVARAVRAGELARGRCEVCGDLKTHAHHADYSKPLEVRWLCSTHHGEAHRG